MIITSHMQKIIQIYPCLLKLSRKQESVTDGLPLLLYPPPLSRGDTNAGSRLTTNVGHLYIDTIMHTS